MQRCLSRCPSGPQWRRIARTSSPSAADPWAPSEPAALALQGSGFRVQGSGVPLCRPEARLAVTGLRGWALGFVADPKQAHDHQQQAGLMWFA